MEDTRNKKCFSTQDRHKTGKCLNDVKNTDQTATCLKQVGDAAMEDVSLR